MLAAVVALVLLKGTVTIGPLTPVCRVGTPCDGPAPRVVLTFTSATRTVHTTTGSGRSVLGEDSPGHVHGDRVEGDADHARLGSSIARGLARQSFAIDTGIR